MLFREAVLSFLGVKTDKDYEDAYCQACKQAGKDNCDSCSREIGVEKKEK